MNKVATEHIPAKLEKFGETLRLYAKALSGREIHLISRSGAGTRGSGWQMPADLGTAVVLKLPSKIDRFPTEAENFIWYKVLLTHQAGHIEFGTFGFQFARPSRYFHDWRSHLSRSRVLNESQGDFEKFLQLFPDRRLGNIIFDCVEDARIDARIQTVYRGIRPHYRQVTAMVLAMRPRLALVPLREAFLEALVEGSLVEHPVTEVPEPLAPDVESALTLLKKATTTDATVEDAAEAALRIYEIAARIPNVLVGRGDHDHYERHSRPLRDGAPNELIKPDTDGSEIAFSAPQEVDFRLANDPALFRQFESLANTSEQSSSSPTDPPTIEGPLLQDAPFTYLYPEWDFRLGVYRNRWCRVRERVIEQGSSDFYMATLKEHRSLVSQVQNRLQHFLPELLRKVRRRLDGEDLDLDALIERVVDRRSGLAPSEKIYWRRDHVQRDVAVALLLDMSATTNEYVRLEAAKSFRPVSPSAEAYSEYLKRIAAGVDDHGKPLRRRTIDIERQAAIILMQALEKIGDSYGLYAFSGSGRRSGISYRQGLSGTTESTNCPRIDRLSPAHGTRMGTAIRNDPQAGSGGLRYAPIDPHQ